jgi:hypothetical protein
MTIKQRRAVRKRKQRNQKILWLITDTAGLIGLIGICYGLMLISYAIQG